MNSCANFQEILVRSTREAGLDIPDDVARHLDRCPDCRQVFDEGKVELDPDAFVILSGEARAKILGSLGKASSPEKSGFAGAQAAVSEGLVKRSFLRQRSSYRIAAAAVITLVVSAAAIYWLTQRRFEPRELAAARRPIVGHFVDLSGTVQVQPLGTDVWLSANLKTTLEENDLVRTSTASTARVRLSNGGELLMRPNTTRLMAGAEQASRSLRPAAINLGARFIEIRDRVKVRKAGTNAWIDADLRIPLETGDAIRTGPGSSARLQFSDGTDYLLWADSILVIEEIELIATLQIGQVRVQTPEQLGGGVGSGLATPTALAILANMTIADVGYNSELRVTSLSVHDGRTSLRVGGRELALNSGYRVEALEDIPPPRLVVSPPAVSLDGLVTLSGRTEPDALLTVNEDPITLRGDGSFRHYFTTDGAEIVSLVVKAQVPTGSSTNEKTIYVRVEPETEMMHSPPRR